MGCRIPKSNHNITSPCKISREQTSATSGTISELEVISEYYFRQVLGQSHFAGVYLWESPETKRQLAVEVVPKGKLPFEKLAKEINILSKVDHSNIVSYINGFQSEKFVYVMMEYCSGKSLYKKIVDEEKANEKEAILIMKDLLCAISHVIIKSCIDITLG
jgi:serine/threonine protein kinase